MRITSLSGVCKASETVMFVDPFSSFCIKVHFHERSVVGNCQRLLFILLGTVSVRFISG